MKAIGNSVALVATLGLLLSFGSAEEVVVFGDNVRLTPVKESSLDTAIKNKVVDPMNTGSRLFDATVVGKDTRLSLNFPVKKFMSNSLKYFRAHPAFLRCLQKTVNYVYQEHKTTIVLADKGFKTLDEAPGSTDVDKYSRSGAGAALKFPAGDTTDVKEIVKGILVHCPFIFGLEMRDIGVVLKANQVFVYMTGASDKEPHFESQTGMSTTDFKEWCLKQIDIAIDPVKTPSCDSYNTLVSGTTYPTSATSPEGVVGKMDEAITRESADFKRLVQFARRKVVFEDSERNSAWCGKIGKACIDCTSGIKGQAPSSRCADRMMSPRLYRGMRVLQKLVREKISGDELKVIDAWDELYEGSPTNGDHGLISLHREGRAAILKLKNGAGKLAKLTQLAICSQMDYVKFDGDKVIVAVKKQANVEPVLVTFPENVLLDVAPPSSKATDYALPDDIIEDGTSNDYPLFDGNVNTKLGISSKTDDFHSTASRYFRAHPALVQCYDEIVSFEKRWTSGTVNIKIKKAFLTVQQQQEEVDTQRSNSHLLGQGLELAYDPALDTNKYSVHRLAKAAIDQCGPIFYKENWYIGIGVNANSVFVGMMEEKAFWANTLPSGVTAQQYRLSLEERFYMAVDGHVVDPLNPAEACTQVPVKKQSPNFKHEHPKHIVRRRKREISDDCVKSSNTAFCGETKTHRETESALIWVEVKRMHLYHNEQQVHDALKGCFEKCGNCVKGEIYETKTEHCNNFLHWAPFSLMNDDAHVTNLFYKDNDDMRKEACAGHCLDKAPLFAQLAPSLERLYRPDPKKSIEEELYGVMDNPLPVYELLVKMYAMHAKGKVTAWVKNEVEVDYIRSALEVVMLHNKEVTEVKIFVSDSTALMAVDGAVESMIADWVKSGCPTYTRETITPFKVLEMKSSRKKRSVEEFDLGQQLREKRKYFEQEWIQSSQIN